MEEVDLSEEVQQDLKKFIKKQPSKAKDIAKCSHVIAISMKRQANPEKIMPEWEEIAAVACAVQNAHIVACQLGVAAYWSSGGKEGPLATTAVRGLLKLEDGDGCLWESLTRRCGRAARRRPRGDQLMARCLGRSAFYQPPPPILT